MTSVDTRSGVAVWRQISETLAGEIAGGVWPAGARLPTESALAQRFGVNRHTLRRAMAELAERGLVRVEQGRGTFVAEDVVEYAVGERPRFAETLNSQRRAPGGRLLRALRLPADERVAKALKLRKGTAVVLIERLGDADGRPISISSHYFPAARFPGLISWYEREKSITRSLARCGLDDYLRLSTRVRARRATAEEARMLSLPAHTPVIETEAINGDPDGRRIEFGISRFASNRIELLFES
jgi:GntR family phosphonate transport system transcriptional regulator